MNLEGTITRLETLQKNMPKYVLRSPEVYKTLEDNFLGLLEELRMKYGANRPEFARFKHWYLHHKGVENL